MKTPEKETFICANCGHVEEYTKHPALKVGEVIKGLERDLIRTKASSKSCRKLNDYSGDNYYMGAADTIKNVLSDLRQIAGEDREELFKSWMAAREKYCNNGEETAEEAIRFTFNKWYDNEYQKQG